MYRVSSLIKQYDNSYHLTWMKANVSFHCEFQTNVLNHVLIYREMVTTFEITVTFFIQLTLAFTLNIFCSNLEWNFWASWMLELSKFSISLYLRSLSSCVLLRNSQGKQFKKRLIYSTISSKKKSFQRNMAVRI